MVTSYGTKETYFILVLVIKCLILSILIIYETFISIILQKFIIYGFYEIYLSLFW